MLNEIVIKEDTLSTLKVSEEYLNKSDWRVRENSNVDYSFAGYNFHIAQKQTAKYVLKKYYDGELADAHNDGSIHIHDLGAGIVGYCSGWDLARLLNDGIGGVKGKTTSKPAKYLSSAVQQMVSFLILLQNEFAGANAFSSVDTLLAPFIREHYAMKLAEYSELICDGDSCLWDGHSLEKMKRLAWAKTEKYAKQQIQQLIFELNYPTRTGGQSVFSNFSFDWTVRYDDNPENIFNRPVMIAGKLKSYQYKHLQKEMDLLNKVFLEIMYEGDGEGRVFTFPIPTYSITEDFDWERDNVELLAKVTAKFGLPYFQNYVGSGLDPNSIRAMCCRLNLDTSQLLNRGGGMWAIGESTGSIGVVTINLNRIALMANDWEINNEEIFDDLLSHYLHLAKDSLEIKREMININLEKGLMPYSKVYLSKQFNNHFSTIGIIGANEACLTFLGKDIGTEEGKKFTKEVLEIIKITLLEFQKNTGNLYNLEASPAEGASYRLAKLDQKYYPHTVLSGTSDNPYLTNSTWLPVDYTDDVIFALEHQSDLQSEYTGGTMMHIFVGETLHTGAIKTLIKKVVNNTKLPYFSITPTFSICKEHGYLQGDQPECPYCFKSTEVFSRVVGFFRPIEQWNDGKKQEFDDRKLYKV